MYALRPGEFLQSLHCLTLNVVMLLWILLLLFCLLVLLVSLEDVILCFSVPLSAFTVALTTSRCIFSASYRPYVLYRENKAHKV